MSRTKRIGRVIGLVIGGVFSLLYAIGAGVIEAFTPREEKKRKWKKKNTRR